MASKSSVRNVCKGLSIASTAYLAAGLVNALPRSPAPGILALLYLACLFVGLLAVAAAFMWSPRTFRALALWSIGPAVPMFGTDSWQAAFPGLINLHTSFYLTVGGSRLLVGANLVPGMLFVLLAVYASKLVKAVDSA
jgi:hypothetical protein